MFSQNTGVAEHAFPVPTPMTVMGEQPNPSSAVTSESTIPLRPRRRFPAAELAYRTGHQGFVETVSSMTLTLSTCWQRWIGPVLHWLTVVTVGAGAVTVTVTVGFVGMAAARNDAENKRKNTGARVRANIL